MWAGEFFPRPHAPRLKDDHGTALSRTSLPAASVPTRRDAGHAPKCRREVTRRPKTHRPCDLADRQRLSQQCSRPLDPSANEESVRRYASALLEEPREMIGAHVHQGPKPPEPKPPGQIVRDV